MKLGDVNSNIYINLNRKDNKVDSKFKVSYHVRISKYKNIFAGYIPNWSAKVFVII